GGCEFFADSAIPGARPRQTDWVPTQRVSKNTSCFKEIFFCCCDKYQKSHCNPLHTWITQHSTMPCAVQRQQKRPNYSVSLAARFIAGARNTAFLGEFTDVPMRSDSADWKRTVFYRRRLLARLVCLVGQYGAGA